MSSLTEVSVVTLCVVGAIVALGFFAPRTWHAERSVVISAAPDQIHPYINNLRKWREWSTEADPDRSVKFTFQGPAEGPGAEQTWKGRHEHGHMKILRSDPAKGVWYEIAFRSDKINGNGSLTYQPVKGGTRVTWTGDGDLPPFYGIFIGTIEDWVGDYYDYALVHLEKLVESSVKARNEKEPQDEDTTEDGQETQGEDTAEDGQETQDAQETLDEEVPLDEEAPGNEYAAPQDAAET